MLRTAADTYSLKLISEVMDISQIDLIAKYCDIFQVGARNMQNYTLLTEVGRSGRPVLLKRGLSATLEELLMAAEYVLKEGNENVMLCERGIRTFEDYVRNTLPLAIVPELHRRSHLPVVVDPSHGTGKSNLVTDMSKAAVACGADGLIIEVHNDPAHAMTDGAQSLTPEQFVGMMNAVKRIAAAVDREV
jgi:3-deoxy-7-phosphoheptulonate synthase